MDIWLRVDAPDGEVRELAVEVEPDRPVSEIKDFGADAWDATSDFTGDAWDAAER